MVMRWKVPKPQETTSHKGTSFHRRVRRTRDGATGGGECACRGEIHPVLLQHVALNSLPPPWCLACPGSRQAGKAGEETEARSEEVLLNAQCSMVGPGARNPGVPAFGLDSGWR